MDAEQQTDGNAEEGSTGTFRTISAYGDPLKLVSNFKFFCLISLRWRSTTTRKFLGCKNKIVGCRVYCFLLRALVSKLWSI